MMEQAKQAGARIVKAAQRTFWGGYAGYSEDPDGHPWEIVWNPEFQEQIDPHIRWWCSRH